MDTKVLNLDHWHLRIREPEASGSIPVIFLLHGWMGTEDVMWIFANRIPPEYLIIAPRAIHEASVGFSWVPENPNRFSKLEDFKPAVEQLNTLKNTLSGMYTTDFSKFHLMGFSLGAAMSFAWAAHLPDQINSIAGLAGFVPQGFEYITKPNLLAGVDIFMGHGTRDKTVPVEQMRKGAQMLEDAGANVTTCEDDVGHKLSANCGRALGSFYNSLRI